MFSGIFSAISECSGCRFQEIQIKDLNLIFISSFGARCSMFGVRCSVFDVQYSMFGVRCSVFDGQYLLLHYDHASRVTSLPLLHYSIIPLFHYSIIPLFHYSSWKLGLLYLSIPSNQPHASFPAPRIPASSPSSEIFIVYIGSSSSGQ